MISVLIECSGNITSILIPFHIVNTRLYRLFLYFLLQFDSVKWLSNGCDGRLGCTYPIASSARIV